jgi:hypothetical protein
MSFQAMAWAVRQNLPSREKLTLLMVANYADERGKAWPSNSTLARDTGMTRKTVITSLKALAERELLTINPRSIDGSNLSNVYVLNLEHSGVTDTPVGEDEHEGVVTELHHPSVPVTHKPIIEPIKEEIEVAPLSALSKKKAIEGKIGSRLPPDWQPSEDCQSFAAQHGVPWSSEAEKFRDYWCAQAGAKGRKADWPATWRNWVRRAAEDRKRRPQSAAAQGDNSWLFKTAPKERIKPKGLPHDDDVIEF